MSNTSTCFVCGNAAPPATGTSGVCFDCARGIRSPREYLESLEDSPENPSPQLLRNDSPTSEDSRGCLGCGGVAPDDAQSNGVCPDCAATIQSPLDFLQSLENSDESRFQESSQAVASASAGSAALDDPYASPSVPQPPHKTRSMGHLLRAAGCLLLGLMICAHCANVILFGGILFFYLVGLGPALVLVGSIDLFFWYDD